MKKSILFISFVLLSSFNTKLFAQETTFTVFDQVLFYDGYAGVVTYTNPAGVVRHRNDLFAKKITDAELAAFGTELSIDLTIKAACDNYDRIGNVNLAFVPKGSPTYVPNDVERIELARFITPFFNKNILPNEVPYKFNIDGFSNPPPCVKEHPLNIIKSGFIIYLFFVILVYMLAIPFETPGRSI